MPHRSPQVSLLDVQSTCCRNTAYDYHLSNTATSKWDVLESHAKAGRHTFDYFRLLAKLVISVISEEMSMFLSILTYFPRLISITCIHFGASSCRSFKWASTATEKENARVRLSYEPMSATLTTARTGYIKKGKKKGMVSNCAARQQWESC